MRGEDDKGCIRKSTNTFSLYICMRQEEVRKKDKN